MINIALLSEFSFKKVYAPLEKLVQLPGDTIGIADYNNTFAHVKLQKFCEKYNKKPIYGCRFHVSKEIIKKENSGSKQKGWSANKSHDGLTEIIALAKNRNGLYSINKAVKKAYDNFYYFPRLTVNDVLELGSDVIIIIERTDDLLLAARANYFGISPASARYSSKGKAREMLLNRPPIALQSSVFINADDRGVYDLFTSPNNDNNTYPMHILNEKELIIEGVPTEAIENTYRLAEEIEDFKLKTTGMVNTVKKQNLYDICINGAQEKGVDLDDPEYKERFLYEMNLIKEKEYEDYFLIVSDLIREAKKTMLVGPARGSSGGSLVCYLCGITEIDPLKYGLVFERFIDINRFDPPDIDTDFPDAKRQKVIKYLSKIYGEDKVKSIGTIAMMKAKSAIGEFAKALNIPPWETDEVKDAIIVRSGGDARSGACIIDTLNETSAGKAFINKYPEMRHVEKIENHARHAGKHAAGVIVANDPLWKFSGIDSRENIIQMDKKDAEYLGLLKIDILGLRTLSILEETAKLAGFDFKAFYDLPLDDPEVFAIFNNNRLYGIFQFEGQALQAVTKMMGVHSFNDIADITSLARPGALSSKGTEKYVDIRLGKYDPIYYCDGHKKYTEDTHGIVIYQEQMMNIAKDVCGMSWQDVSDLRKAVSKSLGDEFFAQYKDKFVDGAMRLQGLDKETAEEMWRQVSSMGSWSFNKSHAVAYATISYWTAWCKAYYPLEFAAANLNHASNDESAVRILRDFVVNDGIEYVSVDPDISDVKWTIKDGKLIGGLTNIKGIGLTKAKNIIKIRETTKNFTPAILKMLTNPKTVFDILFPIEHHFGYLYKNWKMYDLEAPINKIIDVQKEGDYIIIGKVEMIDKRDRNDIQALAKREGKKVDEDQRWYINFIVADDTDSIRCSIPPFKYKEMHGNDIFENIHEGDYVLIKGSVPDSWRSISIRQISKLKAEGDA